MKASSCGGLGTALLAGLCLLCQEPARAGDRDWIDASNANAQPLLAMQARFDPEQASELGLPGFDDQIIDLAPQRYERLRQADGEMLAQLQSRLAQGGDPRVLQDLRIMIDAVQRDLDSGKLKHDLLLPYYSVSRMVFDGIHGLLDPQVPKERQAAALVRLRRYAGMEGDSRPLAELARAQIEQRLGEPGLLGPYRGEMEQDLADSPQLIAGLRDLLQKSGLSGYDEAFAALAQQVQAYDDWLGQRVLPRARADNRLPPALYADALRQLGVDVAPEEIIRRALIAFAETRNEMRTLAPLVARAIGLKPTDDYREVIRALKKKQLKPGQVLPLYRERLARIEQMLRDGHEVTVPQRKASIRVATAAETAMLPAAHMQPGRLIGNTGDYGAFVLPLGLPGTAGASRIDDFSYDAVTWALTAHEARPGHELQFSASVDRGVSIARVVYADNSANEEGWALYAEAEMKPYFPLDGQLIALQLRLLRAARAFLDPMVNLGMIGPEQVSRFLVDEVVVSEGMAAEERDRYTFRAPGQATSYLVGYQSLVETRQRAELALGTRFDKQRFHDFVLAQGLLPPSLLQQAVMQDFVPAELARPASPP